MLFRSSSDYLKLFQDKYKYDPEYHNANGTIELLTYKMAIEKAGSLDRDKVREALKALSYESFYGTIKFSANGQIDKSLVVVQIQKGEVVSVFPENGAVAAPLFKK